LTELGNAAWRFPQQPHLTRKEKNTMQHTLKRMATAALLRLALALGAVGARHLAQSPTMQVADPGGGTGTGGGV